MILPIVISEIALAEAKSIFSFKGIDQHFGLRIGVKGGGCGGTSFFLGFDEPKETDEIFIVGNLKILIEKKHFLYLIGTKLDFVDNNTQRGFTFVNR